MFQLTVSDVFHIRGRGVVATGQVQDGTVRVGDEVRIGDFVSARVDGIEAFREKREEAHQGDNIGLLFASLDKSQVNPGDRITGAGL